MHYRIAKILHRRDKCRQPLAYESTCFHSSATAKLTPPNTAILSDPIISSILITSIVYINTSFDAVIDAPVILTSPIIFITSPFVSVISDTPLNIEMKMTTVAKTLFSEWWCTDDYFGSLLQRINHNLNIASRWEFRYIFTSVIGKLIFSLLNNNAKSSTTELSELMNNASL